MHIDLNDDTAVCGPAAGISQAEYRDLISMLEVFDGTGFFNAGVSGIPMTAAQLTQQSYATAKERICSTLGSRTRLMPYLDAIKFAAHDSGPHFDTTALEAALDQKRASNERDALIDLVELNRFAMPLLDAVGFDSFHVLHRWMDALMADASTPPPGISTEANAGGKIEDALRLVTDGTAGVSDAISRPKSDEF